MGLAGGAVNGHSACSTAAATATSVTPTSSRGTRATRAGTPRGRRSSGRFGRGDSRRGPDPRGALHLGARRGDSLVALSRHSSPTTITRRGTSLSVPRADGGAVCTRPEQSHQQTARGAGCEPRAGHTTVSSPCFLPLTQRPAFPVAQGGSLHFGRRHRFRVLPRPWTPRAPPWSSGSCRNAGPGSAQGALVARREPLPREPPGHQPWGDSSQGPPPPRDRSPEGGTSGTNVDRTQFRSESLSRHLWTAALLGGRGWRGPRLRKPIFQVFPSHRRHLLGIPMVYASPAPGSLSLPANLAPAQS